MSNIRNLNSLYFQIRYYCLKFLFQSSFLDFLFLILLFISLNSRTFSFSPSYLFFTQIAKGIAMRRAKSYINRVGKSTEHKQRFIPFITFLPTKIFINILLKLSTKSIVLCKCICKTWHNLISDSQFAKLHLANISFGLRHDSQSHFESLLFNLA